MSVTGLTSTFPPSSPPLPPIKKYFSSWNEGYVKVKLQSFYRVGQPMSSYTHKMSACLSHRKKKKSCFNLDQENNRVIGSPELFIQAITKSSLEAEDTPWVQTSVCLLNGLSGQDLQRNVNLCCC